LERGKGEVKMNNKLNIEELKYLIPDYITGDISDSDKAQLEDALKESAELREFHSELKGAFDFAGTVKHQEPSPQYWSSLLPRIHQRIEEQEPQKFSWDKVASYWKVLVPIAAIIVIALIYYLVQPSNTQLTKDEEKKNEKIIEPKKNEQKNEQKINNDSSDKDKNPKSNQDNIVKETPKKNFIKRNRTNDSIEDNKVNQETNDNEQNNERLPEPVNDDIAAIEVEETSVLSDGEGAGFDEEIENDLKKLDDTEQDMLLEELKTSNL
jgi:hypothetical protein